MVLPWGAGDCGNDFPFELFHLAYNRQPMYATLHRILVVGYTLVPPLALFMAIAWGRRRRSAAPVASFLITCLSGVLLGTCVDVVYVAITHGSISAAEIARTWYFLTALLCIVGAFRWVVRQTFARVFRVDPFNRSFSSRLRMAFSSSVQVLVLFAVGLPYVIGTMLVHRVHVVRGATPMNVAQCNGQRVAFTADGLALSAWWIPSSVAKGGEDFSVSDKTVVICGGLGDDLTDAAGLVRVLIGDGYNVLFLNPRGHEASEGRWSAFGDLERNDVLAAVDWVRAHHPLDARQIKGLGLGMGGAAIIAAAADPGANGQAIDAVAVFGTYAHFRTLAANLFTSRLPEPLRRWVLDLTLPIASAHAGSDLGAFSPAALVSKLWPRPILVVEARDDRVFPSTEGEALWHEASFPKRAFWVPGGHGDLFHNAGAARALLDFFDHVKATPAI